MNKTRNYFGFAVFIFTHFIAVYRKLVVQTNTPHHDPVKIFEGGVYISLLVAGIAVGAILVVFGLLVAFAQGFAFVAQKIYEKLLRIKKQTDLLSAKLGTEKKAITEPPELILELKHCELDTVVDSVNSLFGEWTGFMGAIQSMQKYLEEAKPIGRESSSNKKAH